MKIIKQFVYGKAYRKKVIIICLISILICLLNNYAGYELIPIPHKNVKGYHLDILTINSIFSGFALTNLGILLSISDDQLVKKLEGTDILMKRNTVIAHSIIFGAISIFVSLLFVVNFNISGVIDLIGDKICDNVKRFLFNVEIAALFVSILYFILSIKKMIELLSIIYVPKRKYNDEQIDNMKKRLENKEK